MGVAKLQDGELPAKPDVKQAFKPFEHFSKVLFDAFCLVNDAGKVVKCNPLMSQVLGKKSKAIIKSDSLDDLVTFDTGEGSCKVADLLELKVPTRFDEITASCPDMEDMIIIMSVYPFLDESENTIGILMVIRDVTAEANLQDKYKVKSKQSITDKLTGLYNRAYFDSTLPKEVEKATQQPMGSANRNLSLVMIDIDHFKKVNDTYGHQAGDYIIEEVSAIIHSKFRSADIAFRYGGEEFIAILPSTDTFGARAAAEKIRQTIEEKNFVFEGTQIPLTSSFGVAQLITGEEPAKDCIARADAALYHAKESGRNRVCVHLGDEKIEIYREDQSE